MYSPTLLEALFALLGLIFFTFCLGELSFRFPATNHASGVPIDYNTTTATVPQAAFCEDEETSLQREVKEETSRVSVKEEGTMTEGSMGVTWEEFWAMRDRAYKAEKEAAAAKGKVQRLEGHLAQAQEAWVPEARKEGRREVEEKMLGLAESVEFWVRAFKKEEREKKAVERKLAAAETAIKKLSKALKEGKDAVPARPARVSVRNRPGAFAEALPSKKFLALEKRWSGKPKEAGTEEVARGGMGGGKVEMVDSGVQATVEMVDAGVQVKTCCDKGVGRDDDEDEDDDGYYWDDYAVVDDDDNEDDDPAPAPSSPSGPGWGWPTSQHQAQETLRAFTWHNPEPLYQPWMAGEPYGDDHEPRSPRRAVSPLPLRQRRYKL